MQPHNIAKAGTTLSNDGHAGHLPPCCHDMKQGDWGGLCRAASTGGWTLTQAAGSSPLHWPLQCTGASQRTPGRGSVLPSCRSRPGLSPCMVQIDGLTPQKAAMFGMDASGGTGTRVDMS